VIFRPLNHAEAQFALLGRGESSRVRDFCVDHKLVIEVDGTLVPIAVADKVTTARLEAQLSKRGVEFLL
jgi:very-short-patch-repair endonuclease